MATSKTLPQPYDGPPARDAMTTRRTWWICRDYPAYVVDLPATAAAMSSARRCASPGSSVVVVTRMPGVVR